MRTVSENMAGGVDSFQISNDPENISNFIDVKEGDKSTEDSESVCDIDSFGRPGCQIDNKVVFKNKSGETVGGIPVVIDFERVLQLGQIGEDDGVISGVSNLDLLHAVVGLYDISFFDMDTSAIYASVCARWARTVVLVQDVKETADVMAKSNVKRKARKENNNKKKGQEKKPEERDWRRKVDEKEDVYKPHKAAEHFSVFVDIFSDTDEDDDDDEDDENDNVDRENSKEDHSRGIFTFLSAVSERQKKQEACDTTIPGCMIGIESRLLACATFEKKFLKHRIIHVTLVSVRPRYRLFRMGHYLLSKCVLPTIVGNYEAVVVHADNSAVEFFHKFGFTDDTVLNSRWKNLGEVSTNCTLMTYLPAFTCNNLLYTEVTRESDNLLHDLDQEMEAWQEKAREAYIGQLCCMMKYRNELVQLRHLVKTQKDLLEKPALRDKLGVDRSDIDLLTAPSVTDDSQTIARFIKGMKVDLSIRVRYTVSSVLKAADNPSLRCRFEAAVAEMTGPSNITELYFCGSLENHGQLRQILSYGFTEDHFTHGEYGRGLYFSKYPSKAAQFSMLGKLLEARVALGNVETAMRFDRERMTPSQGQDSVIVPGRLYRPGDQGHFAMLCQEYIIFSVHRAVPLSLLSYTYTAPTKN